MTREISCRITRTLLMYVREANNGSLGHLLDGLELDEAYLLDHNNWVSHAFLQILYHRMIHILGDENAVYNMALASERFQSLGILDRIARLLGSPKLIYSQAPKYNKILKLNGDVHIHELTDSWVVLEDRYHNSAQKTRYDCDYTRGILTGIPTILGMPIAHVEEIECQVSADTYGTRIWPETPAYGCKGCLYRVRFDSRSRAPFWKRLFHRQRIYRNAVQDLLDVNKRIQEKYDEVKTLASDLEAANKQLIESKGQLESKTADLEASERRYRLLAENVTDIIWTLSLETMEFNYATPSVQRITGFTPEETVGLTMKDILAPRSLEKATEALQQDLDREGKKDGTANRSRTMEFQQLCKDGTYAWVETTMSFIRDREGRAVGVQGVSRDISERKRAEEALSAEKERLRVTLQSIRDGVITTGRNGRITLINPVAEKLTGYTETEALGKPLQEVFKTVDDGTDPLRNSPVQSKTDSHTSVGFADDRVMMNKDGRECIIAHSVAPILDIENRTLGSVLVFRDITKNRKMEKEILKIEKLESLGVLAGGIAHDFNNFLSGIIGNLSLVKNEIDPADKIFSRLERMERAALLARDLTQQLLTFSKGGDPIRRPTRLANLMKESAMFALRGSNVRCDFFFQPDLLASEVDEGQISQVIHNLILNAVQAMPEGGVIHVRGENIHLPPANELALAEGEYVKLTIQDQGTGIKEQYIKKVFDPYFTTKEKGSGLGLTVVYAIIDKHKGRITVDSEPGSGTTFSIYLAGVHAIASESEAAKRVVTSGIGKILVMDDEEFIQEVAAEMLHQMGYRATPAKNGEEAIRVYKEALQSGRAFDAVILDLTVPGGMGGKETLKALFEMDHDVKAIVSSGYSNDPVMSNYRRYGFQNALKKPYRMAEMSAALNSILVKSPTS
ncbi:MAG: PAS domain S-box protein [Deltaproteobacteria bacterium]|nr:PAS domain S-box protein [Deltaproteobacteria bacterium]